MLSVNPETRRESSKNYVLDVINVAGGVGKVIRKLVCSLWILVIFILVDKLLQFPDLIRRLLEFVFWMRSHFLVLNHKLLAIFRECQYSIKLEMVHQLLVQSVVEFDTFDRLFSQLNEKVLLQVHTFFKVAATPLTKVSIPLLVLFQSHSSPFDIMLRSNLHIHIGVVIQRINDHLQVFVVVLQNLFNRVLVTDNEFIELILSLNKLLFGQLLIVCEVEWLSISMNVRSADVSLVFLLCVATKVSVLTALFITRILSLRLVLSTGRSSRYQFSMLPFSLHKATLINQQLALSVSLEIVEVTSVNLIRIWTLFSSLD